MTLRTPIRTAALAAAFVTALAPMPTLANSLSLTLNPRNADQALALRVGLGLYALRQDIRDNGHVTQRGVGHAAGIVQNGPGNQAIIHQRGCNHTGTVSQQGQGHAYGLFQIGCNGTHHAHQSGRGQTGVTIQISR